MGTIEAIVGLLGAGGVAVVAGVVLFILARRAMKFVVRAAIFLVILIALLIGGMVYWYNSGAGRQGERLPNTRRK